MGAFAPAKLNLWLEVKGKRPDGFHEIETLFQTVDWGDEIEIRTPSAGGDLAPPVAREVRYRGDAAFRLRETDIDELVRTDLVGRAHDAWEEANGRRVPRAYEVKKRIPIGGGLGGGSSDAATVLRELQRGEGALPPERLREVALALGSDVPFLLGGGTAVGTGRGEDLRPIAPGPPMALVLIFPPFGTSTSKVYASLDPRGRPAPEGGLERCLHGLAVGDPEELRSAHHNDLAVPALRAYPELRRFAIDVERRLGRPPCMTGSGSTLFDAPDEGKTSETMKRLEGLPGTRVVCRTSWGAA